MSGDAWNDVRRVEAVVRGTSGEWLLFERPVRIVQTADAARVSFTIDAVERLTRDAGAHAVGFVAYEAGSAFGLRVRRLEGTPLVWFAVFDAPPARLDRLSDWSHAGLAAAPAGTGYDLGPLVPSLSAEGFRSAFRRIKQHIGDGDTYQANFTFRLDAAFAGNVRRLFEDLALSQQGGHAAFIRAGEIAVCSASPELFFERAGRTLTARPMKGTAPRGRTPAEDAVRRERLLASPKERAENVMIVDMMRNDLGRVADVGSVSVDELLTAERYPTVWQLTSTVSASSDASLAGIFGALHPSASVTGAPKVRTVGILTDLEAAPRGIYTGAIGWIAPGGDARFGVAIRTAVVDLAGAALSYGVGSGIVWDSTESGEYEECLLKAAVLARPRPAFELLETMAWTPGEGFFLLDRHLRRLQDSAGYFGVPCDEAVVRDALHRLVEGADAPLRVRLRVGPAGRVEAERAPLGDRIEPVRVALAAAPVDRDDVFLYHKTTHRAVYERARRAGTDDVILWNGGGEVTESTIANVVAEVNGRRVTPPVACGLLAGTFRAHLLETGEIVERVIAMDDLKRAPRIWLINSVQKWRSATLVP